MGVTLHADRLTENKVLEENTFHCGLDRAWLQGCTITGCFLFPAAEEQSSKAQQQVSGGCQAHTLQEQRVIGMLQSPGRMSI